MRRSDTSWDEQQKLLADAKTLAEFANLTPEGVESFRKAHRDFFPVSWWTYKPDPPSDDDSMFRAMHWPDMQWQIVQRLIRDAWRKSFQISTAGFVTLLGTVFDPEKMGWDETKERLPVAMGWDMINVKDCPYHTVVRWLVGQSWRVKQCRYEKCRRCFVAEYPKRLYCTNDGDTSCFWAHRKIDKHEGWKENAEQMNKSRRDDYDPKERRRRYLRDKKREAYARRNAKRR